MPHRIENVDGAHDVDGVRQHGIAQRAPDDGLRGQMEHDLRLRIAERVAHGAAVAHVDGELAHVSADVCQLVQRRAGGLAAGEPDDLCAERLQPQR